jgi:hypothetical protein
MRSIAFVLATFCILILAAMTGTGVAAMRGEANPVFISRGFIATAGLIVGAPCYFATSYLRQHGDQSLLFLLFLIAASIGFLLGLENRWRL